MKYLVRIGFCVCWFLQFTLTTNAVARQESTELVPAENSSSLRVVSYNLRYGTANDGPNRWELRREWLLETLESLAPDLLGTQETLALQKDFLDQRLEGFQSWGVGRDDGSRQGEMTAIWYRTDRFEKLAGGHFWLSESPEEPGSISWDSSLTRMASWLRLRDRRAPAARPILFLNTHFDHMGQQARIESAKLLRGKLQEWKQECDVVLTGDFNSDEGAAPYRELFGSESDRRPGEPLQGVEPGRPSDFRDTYRIKYPERGAGEGTFSGFKAANVSGSRIDWIGVCNGWRVLEAGIDRTARDGRTPSDHFAVFAILQRKP